MGQGRRQIAANDSIVVERSGGVTGIGVRVVLTDADLDAAGNDTLRTLFEEARRAEALAPASSSGADRFSYKVAMLVDGIEHEVNLPESALGPKLRASIALARRRNQTR